MQQDQQFIIEQLNIGDWAPEDQENVVAEATMRIGTAMFANLSEQQQNEYKAIVDDHEEVIFAWLEQNIPDYKENPMYKAIVETQDEDPERNRPEKLFASMAWMQFNVPNIEQIIKDTLAKYKQELSA